MAEEPQGFDASTLEGLAKIKAEQQSLRELSQRAADHRDKVTEVYNRVVRDYDARIRGLEEQAEKLRLSLREEFAALDDQFGKARRALDQARFDLQESEFRREIGEYTAEEFQRRQQAIESSIAERQRELEGFSRLRARFLELLPLESLTAAPPAAVPAPAAAAVPPPVPAATPAPAAAPAVAAAGAAPAAAPVTPAVVPLPTPHPIGPPSSAGTVVASGARPALSAPGGLPPLPPAGIGETMVLPPPGSGVFRMPPAPSAGDEGATQILPSPGTGGPRSEAFGTIAIPAGALVEEKSGAAPITHRLGTLTTIGRTPDNQIVVPSREVSRKHAEVILRQSGYTLRDLGSPNGTFVNGKKVTEHALQDGDRIALAGVTFVFKGK